MNSFVDLVQVGLGIDQRTVSPVYENSNRDVQNKDVEDDYRQDYAQLKGIPEDQMQS